MVWEEYCKDHSLSEFMCMYRKATAVSQLLDKPMKYITIEEIVTLNTEIGSILYSNNINRL